MPLRPFSPEFKDPNKMKRDMEKSIRRALGQGVSPETITFAFQAASLLADSARLGLSADSILGSVKKAALEKIEEEGEGEGRESAVWMINREIENLRASAKASI